MKKITSSLKSLVLISIYCFSSLSLSAGAPMRGLTLDGLPCSQYRATGHGPFDYTQRQAYQHDLKLVETYHFTKSVERLIKGSTSVLPVNDLDYTIRAFPNHHRALLSVMRYQTKIDKGLIPNTNYTKLKTPVECYFQRAISYSPHDAATQSLYAFFLRKKKQFNQAEKIYAKALKTSKNNSKIEYSYSLLLLEVKKYDQALDLAQKAYKHGTPPAGLRNKLKRLGIWKQK